MKALVGTFNQEEALVGALSVIVRTSRTFVWSSTGNMLGLSGDDICGVTLSYIELSASSAGVSPVSSRAFLNWV